jgi:hypothetical protein
MTVSQMSRRLSHDGSGGRPPQAGWLVTSRISPVRHRSIRSSAVWTAYTPAAFISSTEPESSRTYDAVSAARQAAYPWASASRH